MSESDLQQAHNEFGRRLLGGLSWTAGARLASQVVTFAASVLLARLLAPSQFGVVAMALVYTTFLGILGQTGIGAAIVYLDDVSHTDLCTMYWANLGFSLLLFVVAVVLSPLAGRFFHNPLVVPVVAVSSFGLVLSALAGVQRTLLQKEMKFRQIASNGLVASFVYAIAAVSMALAGFGVWAIVVGRLLEQATESALSAVTARWRPAAAFSLSSLRRLLGYGSRVWAGNLLFYGQENVDNLVVGRVLGAASLGYYSLAFGLANVPRWFFSGVLGPVMFPAFSSSREQPAVLRQMYLRVTSYSILVGVGLCTGLALVAPEFVRVVYGPKWLPAVTALQILAVAAGIYCAGQVPGPILWALGKPGLHTRLLFVSTGTLVVGAFVGVRWGIDGVALSVLAAVTVVFGLGHYWCNRVLEVDHRGYARAVFQPLGAVIAMSLGVFFWRWLGHDVLHVGDGLWLVVAVVLGAAVFVATLVVTRAPQVDDILGFAARLGGRVRRAKAPHGEHVSKDSAA